MKKLKASLRKKLKLRSGIEPIIGHTKPDSRLDRNYLKGKEGDKINAILSGCAFNLRKLLKAFLLCLKFMRTLTENKRIILHIP
jgi:IS5 family transposase